MNPPGIFAAPQISRNLPAQQVVPPVWQRPFNFGKPALLPPVAKGIPIPTQWPNAKVEQIPTRWPQLKIVPLSTQAGMAAGALPRRK